MIHEVKKILAPIDFSDYSMDAMRAAQELANEISAELHIAHIVAPHFTIFDKSREQTREALWLKEAEEELARIKKDNFANSGKVFTHAAIGHPVEKLVEYSKQNNIDLILLPTHSRIGTERLTLIGSVAEKLARLAPCSVLVFRHRK
jgi:universal stress protein A